MIGEVWHIVIVDDSPDDRAEARRLLLKGSDRRYVFTEADTGAAGIRALAEWATTPHRCIVLDYNLPDMAAPEFLAAISGSEGAPGWPVVVFTGADSAETGRSALRAGAHDYVGKDWLTPQVLVRAVENAAERWALARELQQQSAAAQAREQHFQALAQATSDIVYRMSADWSVMHPLDGGALVPSTDTPLEGWAWLRQNIPADEHARVRQAINEAIAHKALFSLEHRVLRPDGSIGWTMSRAVPILDAHGNVLEWFGAAADITARKAAQETARVSNERLELALEYSAMVLFQQDTDLRYTWIYNPVLNFAASTVVGKRDADLMELAADAEAIAALKQDVLRTGVGHRHEAVVHHQGVAQHYRLQIQPLRDAAGNITGITCAAIDITELKQALETTTRSRLELQTLADNTPDILARFDRQRRHVFVNAAVERVTGLAPAVFLGKTNREVGTPIELCDMWDAALAAVFEKGQAVSREFSYDTATGARHFHSALIPEHGPFGEVVSVLGVTRDRTEEKQAQDALRAADRRKDEFLAMLAHELRNPLAPLQTGLHVLQLTQDRAVIQRTHSVMERQLGQMVRLIDDLLDVSRITSGKVVLRPARIELQAAIQTAIEAAQPLLVAASQVLRLDLTAEPIWIHADPTRISQVLSNLLNNATKYSPQGGAIALSVHRDDGTAVVTVTDAGAGIPQHMLAHIFEMFTQIDRTLDRAQGGLGIGLALVKRLVEMHGGTVSAASAGLGAGSTFTLRLPTLGDPATDLDDPVSAPLTAASDTRLRILVVDDNVDAAESLAALLSLYGHETRVADSGAAALVSAREFLPAVVFLDIGMPGMNGYDTARRMRADDPTGCMTLVALTGWGADTDRAKSRAAGFDHHFTKPVDLSLVDKLLPQVALRQSGRRAG